MSTFVEFNKCWTSGKRSRLFIETVNGNAFMNFSVFLGHPGNAHFAPKYPQPAKAKKKVKSKRKTVRDNERAAKFQEQKRREMEMAAAASAVATESSGRSQNTSSPATKTSSSTLEFSFAEPAPENISSDTSDFANMNLDGNVTIPSKPCQQARLNKEVQCTPQGRCDAQIQTDEMVIVSDQYKWIQYSEWFKANKHKVKPGIRQHRVQLLQDVSMEKENINVFFHDHLGRGVSEIELESLWRGDYSKDEALSEVYRKLQEEVAKFRFDKLLSACQNRKDDDRLPFDLPLTTTSIDKGEPCNSPNFHGCLCKRETWSDSEEQDDD